MINPESSGLSEVPSDSYLPSKRTVSQAGRSTQRGTDSKLYAHSLAPSIKKALNERAQFYRRKLCFYQKIEKLDAQLRSAEMKRKIEQAERSLMESSLS